MSHERGGHIYSLVGETGVGKTTLMRGLIERAGFWILPSVTTRPARPTDIPNEYTHLSVIDYRRLARIPGRLLWDVPAGHGDRYGKDYCDVVRALGELDSPSVHALTPPAARILADRYGPEHVTTVFLPSPGRNVQQERLVERGDDPQMVHSRLEREVAEDWCAQVEGIEGLVVARSMPTPGEQLDEFLQLTKLD